MTEEEEQEEQEDENKRIRPRERARGQKYKEKPGIPFWGWTPLSLKNLLSGITKVSLLMKITEVP